MSNWNFRIAEGASEAVTIPNPVTFTGAVSFTSTVSSPSEAFSTSILPDENDGAAIGSATVSWSDLFLASGAVINFNNGDVTLTHSSNTLAFGGASSGYTFSAAVTPASNDSAALGSASVSWSDLFLASTGVINFNNGDVTLTHSSNTLTLAGGNFVITGNIAVTDTALAAVAGRVGKFVGSVAAPAHTDGYGAHEVEITFSGTVAGTSAASSTWINFAAAAVPGANLICVQNNGIYLPTGITASSAKMIMGARMQYVADDGANPGSLFLFSTNIYSNVLTALFDVNAIGDFNNTTTKSGDSVAIPFCKDASSGTTYYINIYSS
jgi:hypothetical protein